MVCGPPGSSVHGISQAKTLEWVAIPFSSRSFWPGDQTWVSYLTGRCFTIWATIVTEVRQTVYWWEASRVRQDPARAWVVSESIFMSLFTKTLHKGLSRVCGNSSNSTNIHTSWDPSSKTPFMLSWWPSCLQPHPSDSARGGAPFLGWEWGGRRQPQGCLVPSSPRPAELLFPVLLVPPSKAAAVWPTSEVSNPTDQRWEEVIRAAGSWAPSFLFWGNPGSHGACEALASWAAALPSQGATRLRAASHSTIPPWMMVADKAERPPRTGLSRLASEQGFTAIRDAGDHRLHVGSLPTSRGTPFHTEDQVPQEGQKGSWCVSWAFVRCWVLVWAHQGRVFQMLLVTCC